ncbi:cytochrome B [Enterobacter sp. 10-1]|uniref:Cytochrome b n=1 Tax=Raoultella scottii TaxID=3040937 RepID=A0ABU8Z5F6_9ENTR|nr:MULTISPECIES: cytochrome b [Enterobacteriaceae]MVT04133.1 cytochrome b [Raoultella sp. 10-1]PAC10242.1 cytochrome B [Enterobacter sp. 10-1]
MRLVNSQSNYGFISMTLHWLTAVVVYAMFALGLWMVTLGYYDTWYHRAPGIHKGIGILLMMGLIIRILWRFISPPPPALKSYSKLTRVAAGFAHSLLYLALFTIVISGYLISTADGKSITVFDWFSVPAIVSDAAIQADIAGVLHLWVAWGVVIVSILHGLIAFKHHFIDKDETLLRMLGKTSSHPEVKK